MCPSDMGSLIRCWLSCLEGVPCVLQTWVTLAELMLMLCILFRRCTMCPSVTLLMLVILFRRCTMCPSAWVTLADVGYSV